MATQTSDRKPGQFADERFRRRRRAWRKRIGWILAVTAIVEIAFVVGMGLLLRSSDMAFFWGSGIGIALTFIAFALESPPAYIENWRQGAEGEKRTARALRRLVKDGWTLIHDVQRPHGGNFDHVLVGPSGVYVLETKNPSGICSVDGGVLSVRQRSDPEDRYENRGVGASTRAMAAELSHLVAKAGPRRSWVQGVVVLWGDFEQRSLVSGRVVWVHGTALADVLEGRPERLDRAELDRVTRALRAGLPRDAGSASAVLGPPPPVSSGDVRRPAAR